MVPGVLLYGSGGRDGATADSGSVARLSSKDGIFRGFQMHNRVRVVGDSAEIAIGMNGI